MNNRSDSSHESSKLQALTVEALKADKAALAAKRKTSLAKANLKAAKKQLKTAKANLKEAKKATRKAVKKAKTARRTLQACLDRTAEHRKRARSGHAAPRKSTTASKQLKPSPQTESSKDSK